MSLPTDPYNTNARIPFGPSSKVLSEGGNGLMPEAPRRAAIIAQEAANVTGSDRPNQDGQVTASASSVAGVDVGKWVPVLIAIALIYYLTRL